MKKLSVFASGEGTNAENIIRYFREKRTAEVVLVVSNRGDAGVLKRASALGVETVVCSRETFRDPAGLTTDLQKKGIDLIILAGFLWLIPPAMISVFPGRIINIHPALLPKYGGKGMFGGHVHEAVLLAGEKESGITIHYVDEEYDHGSVIFQRNCIIDDKETPESLATKIHELEHLHYPEQIEALIKSGIR